MITRRPRLLRPVLPVVLSLLTAGQGAAQRPRCRVSEVEVRPTHVRVGAREELLVIFRNADGSPCIQNPAHTAMSSDPSVARIEGAYVVGVVVGEAAIMVVTRGPSPKSGAGPVTVEPAEPPAAPAALPPAPVVAAPVMPPAPVLAPPVMRPAHVTAPPALPPASVTAPSVLPAPTVPPASAPVEAAPTLAKPRSEPAPVRGVPAPIQLQAAGSAPAPGDHGVLAGGIELVPSRLGLAPGSSATVAARLRTSGQPVAAATLRWQAMDDLVAVTDGRVTATRPGRTRVVARTPWDSMGAVDVFVVPELLLVLGRAGQGELFAADVANPGAPRRLGAERIAKPGLAWSPDRTRIAFVGRDTGRGQPSDLFVMDVDGGMMRRLTTDNADVSDPVFVPPAGDRIIFTSTRSGTPQLYVIGIDGTRREALPTGGPASGPAVSADGGRLVFVSRRAGAAGLYESALDGTTSRRLTNDARDSQPRYTPEGRSVLFLRDEGSRARRLYRLSLTDGTPMPVTPEGMAVEAFDVNPGSGPVLCLVVSSVGRVPVTPSVGFVGMDSRFARASLDRGHTAMSCRFRP